VWCVEILLWMLWVHLKYIKLSRKLDGSVARIRGGEGFRVLGCYTEVVGSQLPMFRYILQLFCSETSLTTNQRCLTLQKTTLRCCRSQQSREERNVLWSYRNLCTDTYEIFEFWLSPFMGYLLTYLITYLITYLFTYLFI